MSGSHGDPPPVEMSPIAAAAADLERAAVEAVSPWVRRCIERVVASQELELPDISDELIAAAQDRATAFVQERLGELLAADIDRQRSTPLTVIRDAVRFPVEVLHQLGATETHRLDMDRWAFPNDPFALTPASLSELGDAVHRAGLVWGATKAGLHIERRRAESER